VYLLTMGEWLTHCLWINLALEIFERRHVSGLFAHEPLFASVVVGQAVRHSAIQEGPVRGHSPFRWLAKGRIKMLLRRTNLSPDHCFSPGKPYNQGYPLGAYPKREEIMGAIVENVVRVLAVLRRLGAEALNRHLEYCELLAEAQRRWY
jgi:hypothetical protein